LGDTEIFRKLGINVRSVKDMVSRKIENGISHVRGFIENADGNRYLHLDKKCIGLAQDLENYRYPEHMEGRDLKQTPLKDGIHDHGVDALRYYFINRFPIRQNNLRFIGR
jgi:hypothetical protein